MTGSGFEAFGKTRCAIVVPVIQGDKNRKDGQGAPFDATPFLERTPEAKLEEAAGLAEAISLDIVVSDVSNLRVPRSSTLLNGGKVAELKEIFHEYKVEVAIIDHALTPIQQRNLERDWNVKVLDRTGLILEIFGARAQTREGRLQVALAALRYQRGRLVRSWTHLERQRGGAGFLGGPGETQIESDRRQLQAKIERLEAQLVQVKKRRHLHRQQRKKQDIAVIAFVGYTNAGKSTLFNKITHANVFAKDLLFATLDPTLRRIVLADGTPVILSDTVGFISNLPTDLVASFRATLEEVKEADIVVHVRDISNEHTQAQARDVENILKELDIDVQNRDAGIEIVEVWNKADLLDKPEYDELRNLIESRPSIPTVLTSASTSEGIEEFLRVIETILAKGSKTKTISLAADQASLLHNFYTLGTVLEREDLPSGEINILVRSKQWKKLNKLLKKQS